MDSNMWIESIDNVLSRLETTSTGLTSAQAAARVRVPKDQRFVLPAWWPTLIRQFSSPMLIVLVVATLISIMLGNFVEGVIILVMIFASALLGFMQERRAHALMDALVKRVRVHTDVLRDGVEVELLPEALVEGDVVVLRAGDIIPADLRILESTNLLVDESTLTGEPHAVEKTAALGNASELPQHALFRGSHVVSGSGQGVVVALGGDTKFGALLEQLTTKDPQTRFERDMAGFSLVLTRVIVVFVIAVILVNVALSRPLIESLLFALAIGVGITPEMLPAIVVLSLSIGARRMAANSVLVKRLDAIEDIGSMSVLCCDKTGTLTRGVVEVDRMLDPTGAESLWVRDLAVLNAGLQQSYPNPIDAAIVRAHGLPQGTTLISEVPYDFERRRLSVQTSQGLMICKGAFDVVFERCDRIRVGDRVEVLSEQRNAVTRHFAELSSAGFRVLAVATTEAPTDQPITAASERNLVFEGFLTLHDPVTDEARTAIAALRALGIELFVITGDNPLIAAAVAKSAGVDTDRVLTGADLDSMHDDELDQLMTDARVFAAVDPLQKARIVLALQRVGHTVGFVGDGINDTAALRVADVGIAVEGGADVAKQGAAMVILAKRLDVIVDGIKVGRRTFANTLKYIRITVSANFGNMLSLVVASFVLPFIPMLPAQILLLNFLSDGPALAIATDRVDEEQIATPRTWNTPAITHFMVRFGLASSVFDLSAFALLTWQLHADVDLFRSSWFMLSLVTEVLALLVLRTQVSAFRSRPSRTLGAACVSMLVIGSAMAITEVGALVSLRPLTWSAFLLVAALCLGYVILNEILKRWSGWGSLTDIDGVARARR